MNKFKILDCYVDVYSIEEIIQKISSFDNRYIISSVNPEIVLMCRDSVELRNFINESDIRIADGIGIVKAIGYIYNVKNERVTGIDLMENILQSKLGKSKIFLYGAKPGIAQKASENLIESYSCNIVGTIDGYEEDNEKIINEINQCGAEILFVGLGCPKQEVWIKENIDKIPTVQIVMSVGGSFDVQSGNIKRAPKFIQKIHLEWLYRLLRQPTRIKRQLKLFTFVKEIYKYKKVLNG